MTSAQPYRDSHGKTLEDYPHPSVAVDTAVLTVVDGALAVLLTRTTDAVADGRDEWRLPGTFLHEGETLRNAALRSLREKAGVAGLHPRQLRVFDAPDRDDRGWVLSVAHVDAVPVERVPGSDRTRLVGVDDLPQLKYDHDEIVATAVTDLRERYARFPDPAGLLPPGPFVIRDLRALHEAVAGRRLNPDTFRRSVIEQLRATGEMRKGVRGKPAELFERVG
ncbi:NUDIX domain-containing protein [Microbacter sp. GSS18]|nr:NUDIX domain-containing protein [Microbacter sp. GSS18]